MSLIMAKNVVTREQLTQADSDAGLVLNEKRIEATPDGTDSHTPIPHFSLVDETHAALERAGLEVEQEEHALARGGLRYFGGFALKGNDIKADDRRLVLGLRNAHDKSFAASVCIGNQMMVCENLCFSSDVKLARRHTKNIVADLPRVLSSAISRVVSHWADMGKRIDAYKGIEVAKANAADMIIDLVDAKAFPARDVYKAVKEFETPRHDEFKGGSLWTLYNGITEHLKGGDLSKLPQRTMTVQSVFDKLAGHTPEIIDAVEIAPAQEVVAQPDGSAKVVLAS
jgi:hypothetical protein|tara:strand:+ start:131 stop:982 length:852 start_codon:yes stop_codon:yes gene_type:complete